MGNLTGLAALAAVVAMGAPMPPSAIRSPDVVEHLERVIAWYHHVSAGEPAATPDDLLLRDSTRQSSLQAVRVAFEFARAEATILMSAAAGSKPTGAVPQANTPAVSGDMQQAAQNAANRVASVQARISELDASIPKAQGKQRDVLVAQRNELGAELELAKEIQTTVNEMIRFSGTVGGTGLVGKINELERSIPEAEPEQQKSGKMAATSAAAQPAAAPRVFNAQASGIISLIGELFSMHASESQLNSVIGDTNSLMTDIERLRVPLVTEVRNAVERSDQIANAPSSSDPKQLAEAQSELDGLTMQFKQLAAARVPLGDEESAVGIVKANLNQELSGIDTQYRSAARYLVVKGGTLGIVIGIVLFVSELWRRATFRYVHDSRRRRQFSVLRRIVIGCIVTITVILGFVTEFGSLATYAGFVTAGLALALQNVILSIVAYFFLIGRYGIRMGDRVTISNVTGDVIDIGLVRLTMMELASDLHPTGRVVVYSNSVIFQPSAFFKQIPGINYVWHSVTLTLAPDSDFQIAENKLNEAVDSVYEKYREIIEKQHASFEESVDVETNTPKPESRLRFTDGGLVFSVRYPAEMKDAWSTDDQVMKALWDAIEKEPKLKFAPSGTPKMQPVN